MNAGEKKHKQNNFTWPLLSRSHFSAALWLLSGQSYVEISRSERRNKRLREIWNGRRGWEEEIFEFLHRQANFFNTTSGRSASRLLSAVAEESRTSPLTSLSRRPLSPIFCTINFRTEELSSRTRRVRFKFILGSRRLQAYKSFLHCTSFVEIRFRTNFSLFHLSWYFFLHFDAKLTFSRTFEHSNTSSLVQRYQLICWQHFYTIFE